MTAEWRFHIEARTDALIARGLSPRAASRQAHREFGDPVRWREESRNLRGRGSAETLLERGFDACRELRRTPKELQFAFRRLRRAPGFTLMAVLTLGTAIGACTAIYSIVYAILLKPLPYPHPEQIVQLRQVNAAGRSQQNFSDPNFEDVRDQTNSFQAMAEFSQRGASSVVVNDTAVRALVAKVSHEFFDVFGAEPIIGRPFSAEESREGGAPVAIVGEGFWREHFRGDEALSSARLVVNGVPYAVIGVMSADFAFPLDTDIWMPRETEGRNPYRTGHNWHVVARLRNGRSLTAARADATLVAARLKAQYRDTTEMSDVAVVPLHTALVGNVQSILLILLAAVGLLLFGACANLANVLLARLTARRSEFAIRASLGATGPAVLVPVIAESLAVSTAGGILGVAIASVLVRSTMLTQAADLPHVGDIRMSWAVCLFASGLVVITAIGLSGLVAWREQRNDIVSSLKDAPRGYTAGGSGGRLRPGLVVAQLIVSTVLLIGTGLLGRSMSRLLRQPLGFHTANTLAIETVNNLPRPHITANGVEFDDPSVLTREVQQNEEILARLAALPGAQAVGGTSSFPLVSSGPDGAFGILAPDDHTTEKLTLSRWVALLGHDPSRTGEADFRVVSTGYFRALDIPLVRGRLFDVRDGADAPQVAIISETLARTRWPNQDPIGLRLEFGGIHGDMRPLTVIGIVGDVRERGFDLPPRPMVYADERQRPIGAFGFTFVVRTPSAPLALADSARRVLHDVAPDVSPRIRTVETIVDGSIAGRRFALILTSLFGASALIVAVLGIYGMLAFFVTERTREFGIRMALGAQRADVQRLILAHAARLIAFGLAGGVVLSIAAGSALRSQLFDVGTTDPVTYIIAAVVLAIAGLIAAELPAVRATRVDPAGVLRGEG